ncbi:MAG: DUF4097 family beta strand repeat-containing protein [Ignavibacteria bacterium]|nr:DUF4097 family beta strand repeat-containing protein [Ignavibacteria bacterium]
MKKLSALILILIIASQFLVACNNHIYSSGDPEVIREERFQISWGKELKVKVDGGDVTVTGWDRSEVYIKVLGNENAREKLEFIFDNNDSYVEFRTETKSLFSSWFSNLSLKIEVKVPEKFNTKIHTSGGDLRLGGVDGSHDLNTSGGDIVCKEFSGKLEASTSGGDVVLVGSDCSIIAQTSGGDINLNYSGENMGIDLSTSGGDILIELPENFDADMKISSSGGDVTCNMTLNNAAKVSEHKIVAKLNNGGKELIAHTSGGDIDVRKK